MTIELHDIMQLKTEKEVGKNRVGLRVKDVITVEKKNLSMQVIEVTVSNLSEKEAKEHYKPHM